MTVPSNIYIVGLPDQPTLIISRRTMDRIRAKAEELADEYEAETKGGLTNETALRVR